MIGNCLRRGLVDHAWQQAVEAHEQAFRPSRVALFLLAADGVEQFLGHLRGVVHGHAKLIVHRHHARGVHRRAGGARCEVEDAYVSVGQFAAQGLGEAAHGELAGTVGGKAGVADGAEGGADVDHQRAVLGT